MNRIATGIKGFDELVEGGFPEKSAMLLLGSYGTGKSIFGLEYIYNGANKKNDIGLYISFEQSPDALRNQAEQMGYTKFKKLEKEGKIIIMSIPTDSVNNKTEKIVLDAISKKKATRIVIDSLSALSINAPVYSLAQKELYKDIAGQSQIIQSAINYEDLKKNFIYRFIRKLKESGATSLLISEIENGSSVDKVSEYVADGVIKIDYESMTGEYSRMIMVRKMRFTQNVDQALPLLITKKGLKVKGLD